MTGPQALSVNSRNYKKQHLKRKWNGYIKMFTEEALNKPITMTFYQREINRIREICYSNTAQLETAIETRRYINRHFNEAVNLEKLSELRMTSKFHLLRLFKRYYGQTPKQYLTDKRIEKARELLSRGETVNNTCFDIGFESPCSFSTLFKSRVGMTPSEFQKRAIFTRSLSSTF